MSSKEVESKLREAKLMLMDMPQTQEVQELTAKLFLIEIRDIDKIKRSLEQVEVAE